MRKKTIEHYKNNPNDKELNYREKKLMSKYLKLKNIYKINDIKKRINIMLLREQIRADSIIKNMFIDMFPNEYREVFNIMMDEYGLMDNKKVRREKIIESMNLKNNIKL